MWPFQVSDLPLISGYVLFLVFLEGVLSATTLWCLHHGAASAKARPARVLRWGIWGRIGFGSLPACSHRVGKFRTSR